MTTVLFFAVIFATSGVLRTNVDLLRRRTYRTMIETWAARGSGDRYVAIARDGYAAVPSVGKIIVYFPAYPALIYLASPVCGGRHDLAGLAIANGCFGGFVVLFQRYLANKSLALAPEQQRMALWCALLWPFAVFFRSNHSESLFLVGQLLFMLGRRERWNGWLLAAIAGGCSAVRPVGVAVSLANAFWSAAQGPRFTGRWALRVAAQSALGFWGIALFCLWQYVQFGDPLLFAKGQEFHSAVKAISLNQRLLSIVSLEPIFATYSDSSPFYWGKPEWWLPAFLSIRFWNPIVFVAATAVIIVGRHNNWLDRLEFGLAIILLAIPFVTRGPDNGCAGHARFVSGICAVLLCSGCLLGKSNFYIKSVALTLMAMYSLVFAVEMLCEINVI